VRSESNAQALELDSLSKRFGAEWAVDGVTLDIAAGEFMTFLGPSGSGKTTTLNMIAGFESPSAGKVVLGGEDISRVPPHRRGIGMVFQHYALFPHMTVNQNVAYPLKQRKVSKRQCRAQAAAALSLVELEGLGERRPSQLSGGQQQRVALARALVFHPPVLLMDEPLGALDKRLRDALQLEIKRVHEELGITFVYVTHDQDEALLLSDRIAVFREGQIEQIGTAEQLYEQPRTRFVAEFLGDSNVISGTVAPGGRALNADDGLQLHLPERCDAPAGRGATMVLRPERARLVLAQTRKHRNAGDGRSNLVVGAVAATHYLGAARKVEVDSPTGRRFVVREPADRPSGAQPGDQVEVCWSPEDCVVIPDEAGDDGSESVHDARPLETPAT
jgi:putative spermidine/putrescine transport system ATP-binding protein